MAGKEIILKDFDNTLQFILYTEPHRMLEGLNERIVALGEHVTDGQLDRVFTHETNGEISVATKLAKLCWHEEHHLAHIKIALEN